MTAYFSRLAQRGGGPVQGGGRANTLDAGASADGGQRMRGHQQQGHPQHGRPQDAYQEYEQTVDAAPAAVEPMRPAQAAPTVAPSRANPPAQPAPAPQAAYTSSTRAAHDDVRRIDPYRNDPDDDAHDGFVGGIGGDFAGREIVQTVVASEPLSLPVFESPSRPRVVAEGATDANPAPAAARGDDDGEAREMQRQIEAMPEPHAGTTRRGHVRARSAHAVGEVSPRVRAADPTAEEDSGRETLRARATASAETNRETATAVRAHAPQASSPPHAQAPRAAQTLHVQIGRVELEVIAPPPKAPPAPPPQASAPPPAPPARKAAFNPHRHYLRGR